MSYGIAAVISPPSPPALADSQLMGRVRDGDVALPGGPLRAPPPAPLPLLPASRAQPLGGRRPRAGGLRPHAQVPPYVSQRVGLRAVDVHPGAKCSDRFLPRAAEGAAREPGRAGAVGRPAASDRRPRTRRAGGEAPAGAWAIESRQPGAAAHGALLGAQVRPDRRAAGHLGGGGEGTRSPRDEGAQGGVPRRHGSGGQPGNPAKEVE